MALPTWKSTVRFSYDLLTADVPVEGFGAIGHHIAAAVDQYELGKADLDAINRYAEATRHEACDGCDHICGPAVDAPVKDDGRIAQRAKGDRDRRIAQRVIGDLVPHQDLDRIGARLVADLDRLAAHRAPPLARGDGDPHHVLVALAHHAVQRVARAQPARLARAGGGAGAGAGRG